MEKLDQRDLIKGLAIARDPHFLDAIAFLARQVADLRRQGSEAREKCQRQAEGGDRQAQYVLAELLIVGLFGDKDESSAFHWCGLSAGQGYAPAKLLLAGFYESGWAGVPRQPDTARALTEEACAGEYPPALRALGLSLIDQTNSMRSARGLQLLSRAALLGDAYSRTFLAIRQLSDAHDPCIAAQALGALAEVALAGDVHANRMLGYYYMEGAHGLKKDVSTAMAYFDKANELELNSWAQLV